MGAACPECGGELRFDSSVKRYNCQSCGLSLKREEIDEMRAKNASLNPEEEKKQTRKEYLKWWSNKK